MQEELLVQLRSNLHGSCRDAHEHPGEFLPCLWCGQKLQAADEIERLQNLIDQFIAATGQFQAGLHQALERLSGGR